MDQLKDLGAKDVEYIVIKNDQVNDPEIVQKLMNLGGIFFSGGVQSRLTEMFKGTLVEKTFHELYDNGAVFGGTSAGAAVMSKIMITGDEKKPLSEDDAFEIITGDNIVTVEGFGFIENSIIDQHFVRRKRHNRLISLIIENPNILGIGIDESTAILVYPNDTFEVIGKSQVIVYDAAGAKTGYDKDVDKLSAAGIKMHVLTGGCKFDLKERKVIPESLVEQQ
jgi:cyanophycinase